MARFSLSQLLRFKIRKLWEAQGSKISCEEFYEKKMNELLKKIDDDIFKIEHGGLEMELSLYDPDFEEKVENFFKE